MRSLIVAAALVSLNVVAAPVHIVCNGSLLHPNSGRPVSGGITTFGFEFDEATQTMVVIDGSKRTDLQQVSVTDAKASGVSAGDLLFEVNRIAGTATVRGIDERSQRLGITGNYYSGNCSPVGTRKF